MNFFVEKSIEKLKRKKVKAKKSKDIFKERSGRKTSDKIVIFDS